MVVPASTKVTLEENEELAEEPDMDVTAVDDKSSVDIVPSVINSLVILVNAIYFLFPYKYLII